MSLVAEHPLKLAIVSRKLRPDRPADTFLDAVNRLVQKSGSWVSTPAHEAPARRRSRAECCCGRTLWRMGRRAMVQFTKVGVDGKGGFVGRGLMVSAGRGVVILVRDSLGGPKPCRFKCRRKDGGCGDLSDRAPLQSCACGEGRRALCDERWTSTSGAQRNAAARSVMVPD